MQWFRDFGQCYSLLQMQTFDSNVKGELLSLEEFGNLFRKLHLMTLDV